MMARFFPPNSLDPEQQQTLVRAIGLTKQFGDFTAVDHVSFEVVRGEIFGLLGSNGAGKTTTIRMLCGLLKPTSGEGEIAGVPLSGDPEELRKNIGYMSQKFSLYLDLTVVENLEFFGGIYGVARSDLSKRIDELLEITSLGPYRSTLTAYLPTGLKQRVALACAIIHRPQVLFLDEPTAGVDAAARLAFWDLIYALTAEGRAAIVTTHYMDEAEYCHRLALMHAGKIVIEGSPVQLRQALSQFRFYFIGGTFDPNVMGKLLKLPFVVDATFRGNGIQLVARRDVDELQMSRELQHMGVPVLRIREVEPTIEDAFILSIQKEHLLGL